MEMTAKQEADCMAFLAQGASLKVAAELANVSEWDVAALFRPCRRQRSDRPSAHQRGRESAAPRESKPRAARPERASLEAAE